MLATGALSWLTYQGVRAALESEFERRLEHMAAAQQIRAPDVGDIERRGEESDGYLDVQAQLNTLRFATGVANVSLVDSARITRFDARDNLIEGERSPLDSLDAAALGRALAGESDVSAPFTRGGRLYRVGLAPIKADDGRVAGVVAIEAEASYLPVVDRLGRTLAGTALAILVGIGVLAALILRGAWSAARLERQLSRAENLAAMGRLTATLAHEIKNPLAIIRGSAERLGRADPEARRMAEFVMDETDRLSRTVARYLQFARGAPEAEGAEGGDAVAALEATLDLLEGELASRGTTLERLGAFPATAPVTLDNESLKQLYLNLILNSLEAMEKGGRLSVTAAERAGRFEVALSDNGPGIPPEVLERLGSPFFTTKATGSGLGLFLARRLAQTAGGELKITSQPGRGTTCLVRLPKRRG